MAAADLGNVSLEPDRQRDLPPGKYGSFSIKSRSTVTLHSGVYLLNDFMLEPQARLVIDDSLGPVQVVVKGNFTYRGAIEAADRGIAQVLFAVLGTSALVESPFVGALVAPKAQVDWTTVIGVDFDPVPPNAIVRDLTEGGLDLTVSIGGDGSGAPNSSGSLPKPETFRLRDKYTVEGGIIGNGTVTFRFRLGSGAWTTCTYLGQSSSSQPNTPEELIKGTLLVLQSCSDGLPPGDWRTGDQFDISVIPSPGCCDELRASFDERASRPKPPAQLPAMWG